MKGKNILPQKREGNLLAFSSQYIDFWRDKIILVSLYTNAVFIISLKDYQIEKTIRLPYVKQRRELFRFFMVYNENLFLIPYEAEDFLKIDLDTGKITKLDGILKSFEKRTKGKFLFGIKTENHLWCVGEGIEKLFCINLTQLYIEEVKCFDEKWKGIRWSDTYSIVGDIILIPSRNFDVILEVDDVKKSLKIHELKKPAGNAGFLDVVYYDEEIYLYDDEGKKYIWDIKNDVIQYSDIDKTIVEKHIVSRQSVIYKDDWFRIALYDNCIYKYSKEKQIYELKIADVKLQKRITHFHNGKVQGQYLYIQSRYGSLFRLDMETLEIQRICFERNDDVETTEKIIRDIMKTSIVGEGETLGMLEDYLQWILIENGSVNSGDSRNVGEKIYWESR